VPVTAEDRVAVLQQVRAAQRKGRDHMKDYCLVYLPPFYTLRFWIFGIFLWTVIAWSVCATVFVPLFVGRLATAAFVDTDLHDGYSLVSSVS
jgi:hypothetical protein